MARKTVDAASNLSLQQKVGKFIKWLSHRDGPSQELAIFPDPCVTAKTAIGIC